MANRLEFQQALENLLGSRNVYYQPPESVKLKFPCIVYGLSDTDTAHADNQIYRYSYGYKVTLIDKDPDSIYRDRLLHFPKSSYKTSYTADNLHHDVFTIYF